MEEGKKADQCVSVEKSLENKIHVNKRPKGIGKDSTKQKVKGGEWGHQSDYKRNGGEWHRSREEQIFSGR